MSYLKHLNGLRFSSALKAKRKKLRRTLWYITLELQSINIFKSFVDLRKGCEKLIALAEQSEKVTTGAYFFRIKK